MVTWENYEEYMLLYADGELNETEQEALMTFVQAHPELQKELDAYKATQLVPDMSIVFANKDSLLKKDGPGRAITLGKWWYYAAAAAVLLFTVVIFNQNNKTQDIAPIAKTDNTTTTPATPPHRDTASSQELHSDPVDPAVIENNLARHQPHARPATGTKRTSPVKEPVPTPKQDVFVAKQQLPQKEAPKPAVTEPAPEKPATTQPPLIAKEEKAAAPEAETVVAKAEKKKRGILGWLAGKEKEERVTALAEAVGDKIEKVKTLKDNLRDTDVKFKLGQKELFIVRL